MNKAFEKILERLERLEELKMPFPDDCPSYHCDANTLIEQIKQIVQEVSEEYVSDKNVGNNGWISVKDRLPDKAGSYLVIGKSGGATVTRWYMPSEFYPQGHFGGNSSDYIRYWMHRPEPPKERD